MRICRRIMLWGLAAVLMGGMAWGEPVKEVEPPPGGYTPTQLGEVLKKLGYEVKPAETPDGHWITLTRDGTMLTHRLRLSLDRTNLWITTYLDVIPEGSEGNPEIYRTLLKENETIGPSRFTYVEVDKQIQLMVHVGNRELTPAKMRKHIDAHDGIARRTKPTWSRKNFLSIGTVPENQLSPEWSRLQGEWKGMEMWVNGEKTPDATLQQVKPVFRIERGKLTVVSTNGTMKYDIQIDPRGKSPRLDMIRTDLTSTKATKEFAIYRLDGDTLVLVFGADRPTSYDVPKAAGSGKIILKRSNTN